MNIKDFIDIINKDFYTGVPDSTLTPLTDYLYIQNGISNKHLVAANEGNAVAIAAGYYLSTGKIPVVYMQNSGIGNIINPVCSLLNKKIYGIPCIFVIGWRGEPCVIDEPQHIFQGEITSKLLKTLDIDYIVVDKNTTKSELENTAKTKFSLLEKGKSIAFLVKKGALENEHKANFENKNSMYREEIIKTVAQEFTDAIFVSTTGKTSRELFETRETRNESHNNDFLTVGSMGHCSSIALEIALQTPDKRVICLDGDGALLMHMGSMALIGAQSPKNLVHILINNCAHESVGGLPTAGGNTDFTQIAMGCGYDFCAAVSDREELNNIIKILKTNRQLSFIEVKAKIGSRNNLGRPTISPELIKKDFMQNLLKGEELCKQ